MIRNTCLLVLVATCCLPQSLFAAETKGFYLESRTCQVYTGPCFANAEVGLSGRNAIMAWSIEEGQQEGVSLKGLNVVMLLDASQTLGFRGIDGPRQLKSVILVDQRADLQQRQALVNFAKYSGWEYRGQNNDNEMVIHVRATPESEPTEQTYPLEEIL